MPRNASITLYTVAARVRRQLNPAEQDFVPAKTAAQRREADKVRMAAGRAKRKEEADREAAAKRREADREAAAKRREAHRVVVAAGRAKRKEEEAGRDREAKVAARAKRA